MFRIARVFDKAAALCLVLIVASCGGGDAPGSGGTSSPTQVAAASNVVSVVVDSGPTATSDSVNTLFTTVTICVPGSTTECQTIDHVQVDTGSYGMRVLAAALTINLPVNATTSGGSLVECTQFVDGYSWGPVAQADVQVSGETASSVPVQVIGASNFSTVPAACSSTGPEEDTVAEFGANGILGIGVFTQDCGSACVTDAGEGFYYSCTQATCDPTTVTLASQVQNPVPLFTTDNNGTIIVLPSVSDPGTTTLTGSLIFGIDTETNNASGMQTVLTLNGSGNFTTTFNGQTFDSSFLDSGTNGLFFTDSNLPVCSSSDFSGFYCPASTENLSAQLTGITATGQAGASTTVPFSIGNAETTSQDNPTFAVLPTLGGTYSSSPDTFDWGLPFYYGRRVATAIEGYTTSVSTGPYVAF